MNAIHDRTYTDNGYRRVSDQFAVRRSFHHLDRQAVRMPTVYRVWASDLDPQTDRAFIRTFTDRAAADALVDELLFIGHRFVDVTYSNGDQFVTETWEAVS